MTPRERWLCLFEGKKPDRPLCDYWATGEVTFMLMRELGCTSELALWQRLKIDKLIHIAPYHPRATERDWHLQSLFSIWGIETVDVPQEHGGGTYREVSKHPLAHMNSVRELEEYAWPDPWEWTISHLRDVCRTWRDYPILCGTSEPFYLYCRLRGMERALMDLVADPGFANAVLDRIAWIDETLIRRILDEVGPHIDFVYVAEDLGTQESLLMSPSTFRRFLKPRMERLIKMVHSYGKRVFHHDDGAIRPLIPDLIDAGIDVLNPVQWRCKGMDRAGLAADFGSKVVFHGGIDNQETLPFGTPADVRREVRENLEYFRDCRYILAPCHNIQPNTPIENILAMYSEAQRMKTASA
jgi:uroporphyrinogen decarboxylase